MLTHDALCGHGKTVLVAYTIQDEGNFYFGRLAGGIGIKAERLHGIGLTGLDYGGRLHHHAVDRLDHHHRQ